MEAITFETATDDYRNMYLDHKSCPDEAPQDIKTFLAEYNARPKDASRLYRIAIFANLRTFYKLNIKEHKFSTSFDSLCSKYRLLGKFQRYGTTKQEWEYYLKLEGTNEKYNTSMANR